MHLKIFFISALFIVIAAGYAFLNLPQVTTSDLFRTYIDGYGPYANKGLSIILIFVGAYIASLVVNAILEKSFTKALRLNGLAKKLLPLIEHIVSLFIWIMAIIFALSAIGVNVTTLVTGAWVGGLMFALASKEAVSNLFGSLSLIFSKNFKIGDAIKVKGYEGIVEEISLSYTRLIDKNGVAIFMPNKNIVSETIENFSMAISKKAEFAFDIPASLSVNETENILDALENDITKLEQVSWDLGIRVFLEGFTASMQHIRITIESESNATMEIKHKIWLAIKGRLDWFNK